MLTKGTIILSLTWLNRRRVSVISNLWGFWATMSSCHLTGKWYLKVLSFSMIVTYYSIHVSPRHWEPFDLMQRYCKYSHDEIWWTHALVNLLLSRSETLKSAWILHLWLILCSMPTLVMSHTVLNTNKCIKAWPFKNVK